MEPCFGGQFMLWHPKSKSKVTREWGLVPTIPLYSTAMNPGGVNCSSMEEGRLAL